MDNALLMGEEIHFWRFVQRMPKAMAWKRPTSRVAFTKPPTWGAKAKATLALRHSTTIITTNITMAPTMMPVMMAVSLSTVSRSAFSIFISPYVFAVRSRCARVFTFLSVENMYCKGCSEKKKGECSQCCICPLLLFEKIASAI